MPRRVAIQTLTKYIAETAVWFKEGQLCAGRS
jgi:hypothetical protein